MSPIRCGVVVLLVLAAVCPGIAQERDELLATPKFMDDAVQPSFVEHTGESVVSEIRMASGRNYAWFGFNTSEVQLVLPACDNSVYADVEFSKPELFGAGGTAVAYELERGLYDHDIHADEVRFSPAEGETPVEFARAVGTARIRYPMRIRTLTALKGQVLPDGLDVSFDGPFVSLRSSGEDTVPDAASFTGIEPFRAYDASRRQLEAYPYTSFQVADGVTTETKAYWGEVAEVQVDRVDEWVDIEVTYELPPADPLPESRAGVGPPPGEEIGSTSGGVFEAHIVVATVASTIAAELGVTPEEAMVRLAELGFREASEQMFVMSAVQGQIEAVKLFLAAGVPIDAVDRDSTALVSATMFGHLDVALFLVEAGADVNLADSNNATPLFHAAGKCDATELVRSLIKAGADTTPATRGGTTAHQMAGYMTCTENQKILEAAVSAE